MKLTQLEIIRNKINADGFVTRNWCLQRYISRLGARICDLKAEGMKIEGKTLKTDYGNDYAYYKIKQGQSVLL